MESENPAVDRIFARWDRADTPGYALGIVRDGRLVYARGYGTADLEQGSAITPATIFHVASVSKQFAAMSMLLLARDGRVSLDDDVRRHVPEVPDFGPAITIRHLLHHTSGLRDQWSLLRLAGWRDDDSITEGDVLDITGRQRATNFTPGTEYMYSNTGYTLLGTIIRRATGQSLRAFAHERIFAPLGMGRTHFHDDHTEIVPGRTQAYAPSGEGWRISMPVYDVVGATSLHTTVEDLARWDANFEHMRVGGARIIEQLLTPGTLSGGRPIEYAGGLNVREQRGVRVIEHSGGDFGYRAHFLRLPGERLTVIVLGNHNAAAPNLLAWQVVEALLGERLAPDPPAVRPDPSALAAHPGIYRHPASGEVVQVRVNAGGDGLLTGVDQPVALRPLGDDRFQPGDDHATTLTFEGDGFSRRQPHDGGKPLRFVRLTLDAPGRDDLAAYAGDYHSPELGTTYTVVTDGERLVLRHRKFPDLPLIPLTRDLLVAESARVYGTVRFDVTRDAGGGVSGFVLGSARLRGVVFGRTSPRPFS